MSIYPDWLLQTVSGGYLADKMLLFDVVPEAQEFSMEATELSFSAEPSVLSFDATIAEVQFDALPATIEFSTDVTAFEFTISTPEIGV